MGEGSTGEFKTESCGNCHALLVGDYCHHCGQQNRTYVRSVFSLVGDFLHDIANWDSRLMRTLVPLMFRPGLLSNEYVAGHRARYVPPVRLYLFISILFFLVLASVARVDTDAWREQAAQMSTVTNDDGTTERIPFTQRTNFQLNIPGLPEEYDQILRTRIDRVADNPELAFRQARTVAPQVMFVFLPLFALILKVLYLFARRYYVEHLILALHTHSFIFLSFLALFGVGAIRGWAAAGPAGPAVGVGAGLLTAAIWIWIPVYLFIAQHRFYGQHWLLTTIKYLLTAFLYFTMLVFALTALILVSIATA